jgi:hypothetical protein
MGDKTSVERGWLSEQAQEKNILIDKACAVHRFTEKVVPLSPARLGEIPVLWFPTTPQSRALL